MTGSDATADYIEFLLERSAISHVVSPPQDTSISTLALTQRCLASGVEFPVPLPDGTVAINVLGEVPAALVALDLQIVAVSQDTVSQEPEPANDALATTDAETMIEDAQHPAAAEQASEKDAALLDEVPHFPEGVVFASSDPTDAPESELYIAGSDAIEDGAEQIEGPEIIPSFGDPDGQNSIPNATTDADPDVPESPRTDPPPFIRRIESHDQPQSDGLGLELVDGVVDEPRLVSSENRLNEPSEMDDESDVPVDTSKDEENALDAKEREDRMERIVTMLTDLEQRLAVLESGQSGLAERIEHFSGALSAIGSRPVPRPDVSEFNRGLAKLTTALAQVINRLDKAVEAFAQESETDEDGTLTVLTGKISVLEDELLGLKEGQTGACSDLALISSMQETLSHQLAKLLETNEADRVPMMEEFLLDLRHATAELLAEQTRMAQAS